MSVFKIFIKFDNFFTNQSINLLSIKNNEFGIISYNKSSKICINYSRTFPVCHASCVINARSGPGTEYSLVSGYNTGDAITVVASTDNGWYRTANGYYVKADLCLDQAPAAPAPAPSGSSSVDPSGFSDLGAYCLQFVGTPYVYSGSSPSGFDCS